MSVENIIKTWEQLQSQPYPPYGGYCGVFTGLHMPYPKNPYAQEERNTWIKTVNRNKKAMSFEEFNKWWYEETM